MGHFARIDNGIVSQVIVAEQDFINTGAVGDPSLWKQTSYNTRGGVHYEPNSDNPSADQSKALRKNYAGIGSIYDAARDAFYSPSPYASWVLNETTCYWEPPIPRPADDGDTNSDGKIIVYHWDEEAHQADNSQGWVQVLIDPPSA